MVVDPCYVLPSTAGNTQDIWAEFLNKANDPTNANWNLDSGKPGNPGIPIFDGLALCFPSGMGDGQYKVTAELEHQGSWGWRTRTVTIHCLDDPDELEDEADLDDEEDE
jgi:hypothetical protein